MTGRSTLGFVALLAVAPVAQAQTMPDARCFEPPRQYVPIALLSSEQAKRVADAYFQAVFGEEANDELPTPYYYRFDVRLLNGVWYVDKVPAAPPRDDGLPRFFVGGGLHIRLCQSNGRVLELYASQ
jgi:hypothetical protein